MTAQDPQAQLFAALKKELPPHLSLVDEVATVLGISNDSAYRRIRGEKELTLTDLQKLCGHYRLSMDQLLQGGKGNFIFTGNFVDPTTFKFDEYLTNMMQQVKYMSSFTNKKMFYLCKDIPIFHHFHFRELAAFKYFFWMKAIINHPDFVAKKFSLADYPDAYFELGKKALHYYNLLDSVEIWNIENINSTIRQIEFYRNANLFSNDDDLLLVYGALEKLVLLLEQQADGGYKLDAAQKKMGRFEMYYNEFIVGDNSILAVLDNTKIAFTVHSTINFMMTTDTTFCNNTYNNLQNLIRRSTLISHVSEIERARFFKYLRSLVLAHTKK
jgi:hypothetical protein